MERDEHIILKEYIYFDKKTSTTKVDYKITNSSYNKRQCTIYNYHNYSYNKTADEVYNIYHVGIFTRDDCMEVMKEFRKHTKKNKFTSFVEAILKVQEIAEPYLVMSKIME